SLQLAEERRQSIRMDNGNLVPYLEIQARLVDILGRIGDDRALDVFEALRTSNSSLHFLSYLADAEERIRHKTVDQNDNWEPCTICWIPSLIALNASPGPTFVPRRHIYLLIEATDFTEEKLRETFESLSKTYPDPIFLSIYALSNKEFLKQLIRAEEVD